MTRSGSTYYYFQDALGSARNVVDSSQTVQNTYDHYAFGDYLAATESTTNPYRFTGREYESGGIYSAHYYRNRYYLPFIGIFASRDAMWADVHRGWGYVGNSPTMFVDPWGLMSRRETAWRNAAEARRKAALTADPFKRRRLLELADAMESSAARAPFEQIAAAYKGYLTGGYDGTLNAANGMTDFVIDLPFETLDNAIPALQLFGVRPGSRLHRRLFGNCGPLQGVRDWSRPLLFDPGDRMLGLSRALGKKAAQFLAAALAAKLTQPKPGTPADYLRNRPVTQPGGPGTNYYDPNTGISLHPDLSHGYPPGPHYDVHFKTASDLGKWQWFPDGTFAPAP